MSRMLALTCALAIVAVAAGSAFAPAFAQQAATPPYGPPITLDDAKRFRARVTLNPASSSPRSGPTVTEYASEWLTMLAGVRPATAAEYRRDLEKYILPRIGHVRMGALDARKIRRLAYDLREEKTVRAPRGRSWATVRRLLAPFSVMLTVASEDGVNGCGVVSGA